MGHQKLAEVVVSYRPAKMKRVKLCTSQEVYQTVLSEWNSDTIQLFEEFKILLLNRSNHVLGIYILSRGGISGTVVDVKMIFAIALKTAASSIILVHNHPSGNLNPSKQDILLTKKVKESGELLDIKVLDHLIITCEGYYSFLDEGSL